jgi:hypothetical protein
MDYSTETIVIIIVVAFLILFLLYNLNKIENFEASYVKNSDNRPENIFADSNSEFLSPDQITDPDTLDKLRQTILRAPSLSGAAEVAYNDIVSYRRGQIRPFNEGNSLVSEALAESDSFNADMFGNTYYLLWQADKERESKAAQERADKIIESGKNCVDFQNINQCMSVCNDSAYCTGFYIDSPNKCCMMIDPPIDYNRDRYNRTPNNLEEYGQQTVNNMIRSNKDKIIFEHVANNNGNSAYRVPVSRKQCKRLCPKCIMGRCPDNYRCTNMTADPRYNYSCIITNEDRYNENTGDTYDADYIPHLDAIYALNQYAGYDDIDEDPVLMIPESDDLTLTDNIVPTQKELEKINRKYDKNHIGPNTFQDELDYDIAKKIIKNNINQEISTYNADKESDNMDTIATRGENDPVALASYYKFANQPVAKKPTITKEQIETFGQVPRLVKSRDEVMRSYRRNFF